MTLITNLALWTVVIGMLALQQVQTNPPAQRRERAFFWMLTGIGWGLGMVLFIHPELPGPNDVTKWLFQPFSKWVLP